MIGHDLPTVAALVATLGWTLLHFLWQGAVAGVLFGLSLVATARASAPARYRVALFFLVLLAACPVATFLWLSPEYAAGSTAVSSAAGPITSAILAAAAPSMMDWRAYVDPWLPWAVLVWAAGVMVMTVRLLLEWRDVRRLTRLDIEELTQAWQQRVGRLRDSLGVRRAVTVLQSARVYVPMVVGWIKPVILVPVSAFAGLTPWQLELILMHELAHVRRNDYLVNLLQIVVETLLFYHPVVRWVSRVMREERENCCDDLVVASSGDALGYARALAELAGAQSLALQMSVGSDGGKLLSRIKRIVAVREPRQVATHWSVGVALAAFGLSVSGLLQPLGEQPSSAESAQGVEKTLVSSASAVGLATSLLAPVQSAAPDRAPAREVLQVDVSNTAARSAGSAVAPDAPQPLTAVSQAAELAEVVPDAAREGGSAVETSPAASGEAVAIPELATIEAPPVAPIPEPESVDAETTQGSAPQVESQPAAARSEPVARAIWLEQPEFPVGARLGGIEGWVTVNYTIGRSGRVSGVQIVDAQPRRVFDAAVRKAVRNWRFEPIVVDGQATERNMTQTIQFSLDYKMICTADPTTGTRLNTKLCRTKDEIERQTEATLESN